MAKSKKRTYTYSTEGEELKHITFKNLSATYKRYKQAYYKKARRIYRELHPTPKGEKPRYINQRMASSVMFDKSGPLPRQEFIAKYDEKKQQLLKRDSTADPIQYLISEAAYKYSEAEYQSFNRFVEANKMFRKVSRTEFRTGDFSTREEWKAFLSHEYQTEKDRLEELGLKREDILLQAREYIQDHYFYGSK